MAARPASSPQGRVLTLVNDELARIRDKNPGYSLRAFARRLDLLPSTLSGLISGKLRVTRKNGRKILERLGSDPAETEAILSELPLRTDRADRARRARPGGGAVQGFAVIDMDRFHLVSEWHAFAICSLAATDGFRPDPRWIAHKLGIQIREAKSSLERLLRVGLLARDAGGTVTPTTVNFGTTTDVPDAYIRRHHQKNLELAARAMEEDEFSSCDFSAITMAVDPAKLPEAKRRIRKFRQSLCSFMESGSKKRVYRMSVQLFALSDRKEKPT